MYLQVVSVQVSIDKVPEAFALYTNQTSRPPSPQEKGGDEVVAPWKFVRKFLLPWAVLPVFLLYLFRLTSFVKGGGFKPFTIVMADAQSSLMGGATVGPAVGELVGAVGATAGEPVQEFEWKDVMVQLPIHVCV